MTPLLERLSNILNDPVRGRELVANHVVVDGNWRCHLRDIDNLDPESRTDLEALTRKANSRFRDYRLVKNIGIRDCRDAAAEHLGIPVQQVPAFCDRENRMIIPFGSPLKSVVRDEIKLGDLVVIDMGNEGHLGVVHEVRIDGRERIIDYVDQTGRTTAPIAKVIDAARKTSLNYRPASWTDF